jgi:hypothetical protein
MAFVHSLVKTQTNGKAGWCTPVELGEAAPHYVSFVIPLVDSGRFFNEYHCETITTKEGETRVESHELITRGEDSFALHLGKIEVRFTLRPSPKDQHRLPYVGKLGHDDFQSLFMEIEPEDPGELDKLYDDKDTFIIGCEPFTHYSRINAPAKNLTRFLEGRD